ncbi:MAG: hypothetical protein U0167_02650 [bacterium]
MSGILRIGVLACAVWAVAAWAAQLRGAGAFGRRTSWAAPARPAWRGVAYAFGPGMSPWAKESVRDHLPAYFAGVAYHAGIFAALLLLGASVMGVGLGGAWRAGVGFLAALGAAAGTVLLVRRARSPLLRAISSPDDYVSNLLTTAVLALAFARTLVPAAEGALFAGGMLLLLWAPVGKIRHCLFFFVTRASSGAFFGRRGVFPPAA